MIAPAPHGTPGDTFPGELARKYDLGSHSIPVAGRTFRLLAVRDTNRLVDAIDPKTFAADERLPYWAELWTSAIALAEWCLGARWEPGARVLELGCGLGLAGIAAAAAGAHVTMTDYEDDALRFARCNAEANLSPEVVRDRLRFAHLDWRNPPLDAAYDVILGADIVYERRSFLPLLDLFDRVLTPSRSRSSIFDPRSSIGASPSVGRDMCPDPREPDDAVALQAPDRSRNKNSPKGPSRAGLGIPNSEFSASQLPVVVLTEPDRSVGREFFHGARLAGFDVTTGNSVVYWQGRAAGIVRAELRRGATLRDPERARQRASKGEAEGALSEPDKTIRSFSPERGRKAESKGESSR